MDSDTLDRLKSLHTSAIDARNGYEKASSDAEGRGLTLLFSRMIAVHTQNAHELEAALRVLGERPDETGSFMSTVHRTVMTIRSLFGGLDESVIPGLIDGEERNIAKYEDLETAAFTPELRAMLQLQVVRIEDAVSDMKTARN